MISHRNVISNVLQIEAFERLTRQARPKESRTEVALGLLPLSHIYGLVVIAQASSYRGDACIVLPKFELQSFLQAIQTQKIQTLYLVSSLDLVSVTFLLTAAQVPPIIILMAKSNQACSKYDLSSVRSIFTGAAPLGAETAEELQKLNPSWKIRQGYGTHQSHPRENNAKIRRLDRDLHSRMLEPRKRHLVWKQWFSYPGLQSKDCVTRGRRDHWL
jgi:acyl-CoA synthetase (AMP-forming)/AMP-acid ligase II